MLDLKVFKGLRRARGSTRLELDEEGAYAIGRVFVDPVGPKKIAVGHDSAFDALDGRGRHSGGASEAGADVLEALLGVRRDGRFAVVVEMVAAAAAAAGGGPLDNLRDASPRAPKQ